MNATGRESATDAVLADVAAERRRQDARWGEQNWPDGTGSPYWQRMADVYREQCDAAYRAGTLTFSHITLEEVAEALAESDPDRLRAELVQAAAVIVNHIEAIDRRRASVPTPS